MARAAEEGSAGNLGTWGAGRGAAARRCSSGVEQLTCNQQVVGSTPTIGSWLAGTRRPGAERYPSGQREQTVNLPANAYGGSNPPLSIMDAGGPSAARALRCSDAPRPRRPARALSRSASGDTAGGSRVLSAARALCARRSVPSRDAGVAQMAEREPSKLGVAGSNPVSRLSTRLVPVARAPRIALRSSLHFAAITRVVAKPGEASRSEARGPGVSEARSARRARALDGLLEEFAHVAQSAEHFLGKEEVTGSTPVVGSSFGCRSRRCGI